MNRVSQIVFLLILVGLILLSVGPAQVAAGADPVQAALGWLHTQQAPDGSFGIVDLHGVYTPDASMTADVVYALALAGEDPGGAAWAKSGQSALDALAKLAPGYVKVGPGEAGKVARAVAAAGRDPRAFAGKDLIAMIEAAYNPNTGRYDPTLLFRSTIAIEALQLAKAPVPPAAYEALRKGSLPDGGWFWAFYDTPRPQGPPPSDVDSTGRVLKVLAGGPQLACDLKFIQAANFLARVQTGDGSWRVNASPESSAPNADSTALAILGLRAIGRNPEAAPYVKGERNAVQALLAFRQADGSFAYSIPSDPRTSRVIATAEALVGLLQPQAQTSRSECLPVYLPMLLQR